MNLSNHLYKKFATSFLVALFMVGTANADETKSVATVTINVEIPATGKASVQVKDALTNEIKDCDLDKMDAKNTDSMIHMKIGERVIEEAWYELSNGERCRVDGLIGRPLFTDLPNPGVGEKGSDKLLIRGPDHFHTIHKCIIFLNGRLYRGHEYCPWHKH